jgi:hypothetical protein
MRALVFVLVGAAACEPSELVPPTDAEVGLFGLQVSLAPGSELELDELRARLAKLEVALAELETLPDPEATEEVAAMQLRRRELVRALDALEREARETAAHVELQRAGRLQAAIEQLEQDLRDTRRSVFRIGAPDEELLMRNDHSVDSAVESASYEFLAENACLADAE